MKKGKQISYTIPMLAALVAILISIPLRVYQYFKIIEPNTGFYNKTDFSVYLIYFLLGAAMIISVLIPFISHSKVKPVYIAKKSVGLFMVSLIMSIGIIADSVLQLKAYFDLYSVDLSLSNQTLNEYLSSQGGSFLLAQSILGFLAAVFFLVYGLSSGIAGRDGTNLRILALLPILWCIFRLLYRFKRTISFINVSDLLLELFTIVFSMMFFLAFAQVVSKVDANTVYWKIFAYGIPAVMFALMCFLPRLFVTVTGSANLLSEHYKIQFSDLSLVIFVIYSLVTRAGTKSVTIKK